MNIFFTSPDPKQCAYDLDLKRCNKMVLESVQMASTAVLLSIVGKPLTKETRRLYHELSSSYGVYKPTHSNHPSNIWLRESRSNFFWLLRHIKALNEVRLLNRQNVHKSMELLPNLVKLARHIPDIGLTPFANCAANNSVGVSFKHLEVHTAYKKYLVERWKLDKIPPKWHNGLEPNWRR